MQGLPKLGQRVGRPRSVACGKSRAALENGNEGSAAGPSTAGGDHSLEGEGPFIVTPALQSHGGPRADQHSMGNGSAFKRFLMVGKDFGQTEVNALAFPAPLAARWEQTVSCV